VSESITYLHVYVKTANSRVGVLRVGQMYFPCFLGKNGKTYRKREGDGKSPIGKWKLEQLYYRPDKMGRPNSAVNCKAMKPNDGWCDAAGDGRYNRHVTLPFKASHEKLWRADQAYDLIATTNHNMRPRKQAGGSAIFLHVINKGATGTEGCIAMSEKHLRIVLRMCSNKTYLVI
jgi:L,D-peptidoglycan transpeptidase YkuD (ErfK/YbiS/YcfS/YnhG family)